MKLTVVIILDFFSYIQGHAQGIEKRILESYISFYDMRQPGFLGVEKKSGDGDENRGDEQGDLPFQTKSEP